jgi:hypothetical protein
MTHAMIVVNDLYRTRFSCCRMIWLLPTPTPSPVSKLERDTQETEKERQYADGRGEGVGVEPNHTTARKPGPR